MFLLLLLVGRVSAQSFQWGKRAGSAQTTGGSEWEHVNSMAVDVHGNIYAVGHVAQASVNVDGAVKNGNGGFDIVMASFDCTGKLRWWKVMGTYRNDYAYEVCTDKLDGVYMSCFLDRSQSNTTVNIDTDTSFTTAGKIYKGITLIKYDTAGNYKWMRQPQSDTIGITGRVNSLDLGMNVDSSGTIYWMWQMYPGEYINGALVVNAMGDYIVKYDKNGNFLGSVNLNSLLTNGHLARDVRSGRYYYAGDGNSAFVPMYVNGNMLTSAKFIAAYNKDGKLAWLRQSDPGTAGGFYGDIAIDKDGSLYLASLLAVGEKFEGYSANIPETAPLMLKLDTGGHIVWAKCANVNGATFTEGGASLRNSGEVILHGKFPGLLKWQDYNDSFNLPKNSGYRPFITRFNTTTGKVLGIDQLPASGCEEYATVSDGRDNVYIGGNFYTTLTVAGNTLAKVGGESDWYIAKYGHNNCNCTNIPEPQFSMTKTGQSANFTYTGSSGITTYRWDFGDGDSSTVANPTHNYKDSGNYIVCLQVTNTCGDNTYCRQVYLFPNSIPNVLSAGDVSIYPNPVKDVLTLDGLQPGVSVVVYDLYGRKIIQQIETNKTEQIATADWLPGTYLVQITDGNGNRYNQKMIKE